MGELVKFSLKRRFVNTATILLNVMLCLVLGAAFFADKLVDLINPQLFEERVIYLCNLDERIVDSLFESEQSGLKFIVSEEDPKHFDNKEYQGDGCWSHSRDTSAYTLTG